MKIDLLLDQVHWVPNDFKLLILWLCVTCNWNIGTFSDVILSETSLALKAEVYNTVFTLGDFDFSKLTNNCNLSFSSLATI